jgi:hypothetical protein
MGGGARVWGSVSVARAEGDAIRSQTSSVFTFVNDKPPFKVLIIFSTSTFSYESLQYVCRSFFLLMLQLISIKAYMCSHISHITSNIQNYGTINLITRGKARALN